jgi:hypothetical protein
MQNKTAGYIGGGLILTAVAFGAGDANAVTPDYKSLKKAEISVQQFENNKKQGKYIMPDHDHWTGYYEPGESFDDFVRGSQRWAEGSDGFYARKFNERRFRNALEGYAKTRDIDIEKMVASPCKHQFMADYTQEVEKDLEELEGKYKSLKDDVGKLREKKDYSEDIARLERDYIERMGKIVDEMEYLEGELESLKDVRIQPPPEDTYAGSVEVQPGYVFVNVLPVYPYGVWGPIFEYYVVGGSIFRWDPLWYGFCYYGRFGDYYWDSPGKIWRMREGHGPGHHRSRFSEFFRGRNRPPL